jgi:hypothetical protein
MKCQGLGHRYYCLKLFEASSHGTVCKNQEHRRAELNVGVHSSAARIEFLAATGTRVPLAGTGVMRRTQFNRMR